MIETPKIIKDIVYLGGIVGFFVGGYLALDNFNDKADKIISGQNQVIVTMRDISDEEKKRDAKLQIMEEEWYRDDVAWNTKILDKLGEIQNDLKEARDSAVAQRKEQTNILQEIRYRYRNGRLAGQ